MKTNPTMTDAVIADDVDLICAMSVDQLTDAELEVHSNAIRCVKYLLTVPGMNVNIRGRMTEYGRREHTPFSLAITRLLPKGKLSDNKTVCACLLANDHRVDLNVQIDCDFFTRMSAIQAVTKQSKKSHDALLLAMVRNPSIDINMPLPMPVGPEREFNYATETKQSFFICAMQKGRENLFFEMIKNPKLNPSYQCSLYGRTALHYAVERNLHFAVTKLLEMMNVEQVNQETTTSLHTRALTFWPGDDDSEHSQLLLPFIKSPKFKIDGDVLGMIVRMYTMYVDPMTASQTPGARARFMTPLKFKARIAACFDLVDALLARPDFDMADAVKCDMPFRMTLDVDDDTMLMKLLTWPRLDGRVLKAKKDMNGQMEEPFLSWVMMEPPKPFGIRVFRQLMKFGEIRDQIMDVTETNLMNAVHIAVSLNRDDILSLLLATTTDNPLVCKTSRAMLEENATPRQIGKIMKNKKCVDVIDKFMRQGKSKVEKTKRGYVFDCC